MKDGVGSELKQGSTTEHRGFPFVQFAAPEDANRAIELKNGSSVGGRKIGVKHARAPLEQHRSKTSEVQLKPDDTKTFNENEKSGKPEGAPTMQKIENPKRPGKASQAAKFCNDPADNKGGSEKQRVARTVIYGGLLNSHIAEDLHRCVRQIGNVSSITYPLPKKELEHYGLAQEGCKMLASAVVYTSVKAARFSVEMLHQKEIRGGIIWARQLGSSAGWGGQQSGSDGEGNSGSNDFEDDVAAMVKRVEYRDTVNKASDELLKGRQLTVCKALKKKSAHDKEVEKTKHVDHDLRNLDLEKEGLILKGARVAEGVSTSDMSKCQMLHTKKITNLRSPNFHVPKTKLQSPNFHVSKTRYQGINQRPLVPWNISTSLKNQTSSCLPFPDKKSKGAKLTVKGRRKLFEEKTQMKDSEQVASPHIEDSTSNVTNLLDEGLVNESAAQSLSQGIEEAIILLKSLCTEQSLRVEVSNIRSPRGMKKSLAKKECLKVARTVIYGGLLNSDMADDLHRRAREIGNVSSITYPLPKEELEHNGLAQEGCKMLASAVVYTSVKAACFSVKMLHQKEIRGGIIWARQLGSSAGWGGQQSGSDGEGNSGSNDFEDDVAAMVKRVEYRDTVNKASDELLKGRQLTVCKALKKKSAHDKEVEKTKHVDHDLRNLDLEKEGLILKGARVAEGVSTSDMSKCQMLHTKKITNLRSPNFHVPKTKLQSPNFHVSKTRYQGINQRPLVPWNISTSLKNQTSSCLPFPDKKSKGAKLTVKGRRKLFEEKTQMKDSEQVASPHIEDSTSNVTNLLDEGLVNESAAQSLSQGIEEAIILLKSLCTEQSLRVEVSNIRSPRGMKKSLAKKECLKFLNTANKEELKGFRGIGEKRAAYILELRQNSREYFKDFDDLKNVGLSEKQIRGMMKKIARDMIA